MTRGGLQVGGNYRGDWEPDVAYNANDLVTYQGAIYPIKVDHVSGASFNAAAVLSPVSGGSGVVENVNTVAASGAATTLPDVTTATMHDVTLTANCTLTFPTVAAGKSFVLRLKQDATGSRLVTWPAIVKWAGDVEPTLSTGANKEDVYTFMSIGGTNWIGGLFGRDFR